MKYSWESTKFLLFYCPIFQTKDTYTLTVRGTDLNGMAGGRSSTGDVVIKLLDINDNIPTLEKEMVRAMQRRERQKHHFGSSLICLHNFRCLRIFPSQYVGHVEENTVNVEVMRVRAIDLDMMYTDNWLSVFSFASGNEAGYFSITTDSKTNEGVIMIQKVHGRFTACGNHSDSFKHVEPNLFFGMMIHDYDHSSEVRFHSALVVGVHLSVFSFDTMCQDEM